MRMFSRTQKQFPLFTQATSRPVTRSCNMFLDNERKSLRRNLLKSPTRTKKPYEARHCRHLCRSRISKSMYACLTEEHTVALKIRRFFRVGQHDPLL